MKHEIILRCIEELGGTVDILSGYVEDLKEPNVSRKTAEELLNDNMSLENFLDNTPGMIQSITKRVINIKERLEAIVEDVPENDEKHLIVPRGNNG